MSKVKPFSQNYLQQNSRTIFKKQIVYCDVEDELNNICTICFETGKLINPCSCRYKYHQICLLQDIRRKLLRMRGTIDMNQIKCWDCKQSFRIKFAQQQRYTCYHYLIKLQNNYCERLLIVVLVISIILGVVGLAIYICSLFLEFPVVQGAFYGLIAAESLLFVIFLISLFMCIRKNLKITQITLSKVYDYHEKFVHHHSHNTSSSQEQNQIYSQNLQIIIDDQNS